MGSGEQAPQQGSALSAQLAKLAKPGAAAFRIICNNLKQQQCTVRNTMEEVQVNGSHRSVIKVNGDAEENYLFPAHLLEKLQDVDINQVYANSGELIFFAKLVGIFKSYNLLI